MSKLPPEPDYEYVVERIARFIREAVERAGVKGVVLGLSGGVDSATTAALCVKALGSERVEALILPDSETTPREDVEDAEALASQLKLTHHTIDIHGIYEAYGGSLPFHDPQANVANGNLRARIRMTILYYYANLRGLMVCGTGDKSELLLGYYTKYGDGGVDILPIADLYKTQVRRLALRLGIPERIAMKPSSPRLWPGQMAEKELGVSYEVIDPVLYLYVEKGRNVEEIVEETGVERETVEAILRRVHGSEHKRMPPPIARVSPHTVGHDWRLPWNP